MERNGLGQHLVGFRESLGADDTDRKLASVQRPLLSQCVHANIGCLAPL